LSRLIGNVLTFARQRKKTLQVNPTSVDPVALVHQIAERFAPSLEEKGMQLTLEGQAGTNLSLDRDFVEQILGNLISNVEKYAASGNLLMLRTSCSAKQVTFDVIDAGPGIPSKYQSTVFEPFERLNNGHWHRPFHRARSGTHSWG
jgi:signal transduction histidine kinase